MEQLLTTLACGLPICSRAMGWKYIYFAPINSHKYRCRSVTDNVTE